MGFVDPAFKNIKLGQTAFLIWRIENFEIKPLPNTKYGSFHEGDSYIVYSAVPAPGKYVTKNVQPRLEYHIHFWIGSTTTTDESTTAAIKTVELDEVLNGIAVHHRELQGYESNRFKSYFKNGIRILKGGVASGLHHVTDTFTPRLFKIKGKRRPIMTEQPAISWQYFNSGDVFILELGDKIFVWVGKDANMMEKFQAGKVAAQMKNERPARTVVFVDELKETKLGGDDLADFEQHLPLAERVVRSADDDISDVKNEVNATEGIKLYKCTDHSGTFQTIFVKDGPLKQADLNSLDTYIIVNNAHGIWVWIGKKASEEERSNGMKQAYEFLKKVVNSEKMCVTRVVDGGEPVEFQMLFADWKDPNASVGFGPQSPAKKTVNIDFDAAKLHEIPSLAADTQLVDNGNGKTQVWRLHNNELEPVPEDHFGLFFSGDCYLILYTYHVRGREKHLLYFWQGAHSSVDERGAIAWHAVKKDEELNGLAVQVRVVQSKEDPQFLLIFKGKMIVFNGGYASSFDGPNGKNSGIPSKFMIQVRGGEDHSTRSVEVKFSSSSLNTNDVFVLCVDKRTYVWCGKGSTGDERERAKEIANQWSPVKEHQLLLEGHETNEFWKILGGKEPYASDERLSNPEMAYPARLFHCSNASGYFKAEEILDFSQCDLVPNDVMVLDIGHAVFIWVGRGANKTERVEAPKLVEKYLKTDPRGRDLECPIVTIQQGREPPNFTGFFGAWDDDLWDSSLYMESSSDVPQGFSDFQPKPTVEAVKNRENMSIYPLSELANKTAAELPEDVDVSRRELHLGDEEFESTFGMNINEFEALPMWKRNNMKKDVGLF
ncbi:hypothetical protein RUM43_009170 [Polyplax serrata]|uniref:HP domain-containing protein n=1 Tax=Polyplax serrata TaxID=468196 RepID=A0AAN8PHU4_POLSC